MSEIKINLSIGEENIVLFKRAVRKLLESTFILCDKDVKLYNFVMSVLNC